MSKNCMITFDQNEHGTYFTGQVVSGKIIVNLNRAKKLKGIKLQISGYACAQWRQRRGRNVAVQDIKRRQRRIYFGREEYVNATTYLHGSELGPNITVDAGTYTYTFSCPIPANVPSSFEGTFGHIRYIAKVIFLRSGAANRTHNVGFTVLKLLDLNHESKLLQEPATNEAIEHFCLMQTKPVYLTASVAQTGYVPGQIMLINAHLRNNTNTPCKKLVMMLYLRATYTAEAPSMRTTSEKMLLVRRECSGVSQDAHKVFSETLRIPATAPTCEHLSKVVRVSYELVVVAEMIWLMANPKVTLPITIGNVPLMTVASTAGNVSYASTPDVSDLPTTSARAMALSQSSIVEGDLDDYALPEDGDDEFDTAEDETHDLPPPTYEQAMFMTADIADTDVNTVSESAQFTPRYPVYDVDTFQSPPPNPPQKRRRRRRRRTPEQKAKEAQRQQMFDSDFEKPTVESPIQI